MIKEHGCELLVTDLHMNQILYFPKIKILIQIVINKNISIHLYINFMKGELSARPQSKGVHIPVRPAAIYAKPELAAESFAKGKEYQGSSSFQKAIEEYLRTLMYDPNYFQAYCNMGSCYRAQGKYLEARSMYLKAIAIKTDDAISHYNLANTLRIIGNYEDSIKHYQFVIGLGQRGNQSLSSLHVNSLINLGICYKQTQEHQKSIQCFEKARNIDSKDEQIIFNEAMAYMAILQAINTDLFYEVAKEKAEKAQGLLKQIIKNNPKNEMAALKLNRVSVILDKSNKNLNIVVNKLKGMLESTNNALKIEINEELGYALNLLRQYEKSAMHYQQSVKDTAKPIVNIYDTNKGFMNDQIDIFSQEEANNLVNNGMINEATQMIAKLDDNNISKHVIQLAIQIKLSQTQPQPEQYLNNAVDIYNKHFIVNKKQLPDQSLSIQAHKVIGKLFSLQNKFKESIRHFEYISSQLKNTNQRSKVRSSLGNDYEAIGDKQKALEQYKLALAEQPDNYEIMYNIGCCLHDEKNHEESRKYFQKFLTLIQNDNRVYLPTKNIYIADCLITMASASANTPDEYKRHQTAWKAIKQSRQGEKEENVELQSDKLLDFCLRWADILQTKLMKIADKKSEEYLSTKEVLLHVYLELLDIQACPDRDAILNNCAIIYYEEKLYVNALANLNQVVFPTPTSLNSLALTYFHLGEHIMATSSISEAFEQSPSDQLIKFNKEVMEWVYGIEKQGAISKLIDNREENLVIARWQYGILLVDAFSQSLKKFNDDENFEIEIPKLISKLLDGTNAEQYLDAVDKIKFRFIYNLFKSKAQNPKASQVPQRLLSICTKESSNLEKDLKLLTTGLQNEKQASQTIIQLLIGIFIFVNRKKTHSIHSILSQYCQRKNQRICLQLDRKVSIPQDEKTKQYSFQTIDDIIANLCTWQCQLETKTVILMACIEKNYYNCRYRYPLEVQYHFPRHNQLQSCSSTLNRLISLVYGAFNIKSDIDLQDNSTIPQMKNLIMSEFQSDFDIQMRVSSNSSTLKFNQKLTLATIYANFLTKQECIKFIKDLQKDSTQKSIDFNQDINEIELVISQILTINCTWTEKLPLFTAVKSLISSPLSLDLQAVLQIDSDLELIREQEKYKQLLSGISQFNY